MRAVTPSSRPISSTILPSFNRSTVVPVKYILQPLAAGSHATINTPYGVFAGRDHLITITPT